MQPSWTPPDPTWTEPAPARRGVSDDLLSSAEHAVTTLEIGVEGLATGGAREPLLVEAGRASALLAQVDTEVAAAPVTVRRRAVVLRSRYDAALLRLGSTPDRTVPIPVQSAISPPLPVAGAARPDHSSLWKQLSTVVVVAGVLLLLFAGYTALFGHLTYERNQRLMLDRLNKDFTQAAAIARASVAGDRNLGAVPPRGTPVALLEIPSIHLRQVVVQGTGTKELREAVGHYRPSPMPGQVGNAVLAGHRNLYGRPFADLRSLHGGDKIVVTTQEGRFTYVVDFTLAAQTGQEDFLSQAGFVNRLTLITTNYDGNSGRFAVISRLQGSAAILHIRDGRPLGSDELGLSRDSSAFWPSLGWFVLLIGAGLGTYLLYERWRWISAYLITTPVLVVLGLLLFESVGRLVPSTF